MFLVSNKEASPYNEKIKITCNTMQYSPLLVKSNRLLLRRKYICNHKIELHCDLLFCDTCPVYRRTVSLKDGLTSMMRHSFKTRPSKAKCVIYPDCFSKQEYLCSLNMCKHKMKAEGSEKQCGSH